MDGIIFAQHKRDLRNELAGFLKSAAASQSPATIRFDVNGRPIQKG